MITRQMRDHGLKNSGRTLRRGAERINGTEHRSIGARVFTIDATSKMAPALLLMVMESSPLLLLEMV